MQIITAFVILYTMLRAIYNISATAFWIFFLVIFGILLFCYWDAGTNNIGKAEKDKKQEEKGIEPDNDFQQKLDNGELRTYDDIVYHNGIYYENENSEEWEDFEYQYEEDHRR